MFGTVRRLLHAHRANVEAGVTPFYDRYPYRGPLQLRRVDRFGVIDPRRRFFYNRIAKAANSTMTAVLAKAALGLDIGEKKKEAMGPDGFLSPSQLSGKEVGELPAYFKFTFVRDPYSRALSAYLNKVVFHRRRPFHKGPVPSFAEYCRRIEAKMPQQDQHFLPQTDLFLLPLKSFDFVGRVERLDEDIAFVLDRLDLPRPESMRVGNATSASDRLDAYYDAETRAIVRRVYARDFEELGY